MTDTEAKRLQTLYPDLPVYQLGSGIVKIPLGYVLDKLCDLKGYQVGPVGLYQAQALVLVNYGGAASDEIKTLLRRLLKKVFTKTNITITPEVTYISTE